MTSYMFLKHQFTTRNLVGNAINNRNLVGNAINNAINNRNI